MSVSSEIGLEPTSHQEHQEFKKSKQATKSVKRLESDCFCLVSLVSLWFNLFGFGRIRISTFPERHSRMPLLKNRLLGLSSIVVLIVAAHASTGADSDVQKTTVMV